jgi:hypothetical protein
LHAGANLLLEIKPAWKPEKNSAVSHYVIEKKGG